jgi:antirestriction protein ArdC
MPKTKTPKADAYQRVTEKVLTMLEEGTVPWRQPWASVGLPMSMSTRKPYRGINPFLLIATAMAEGYTSPWWGTYDQIAERGGQVRKGEKSTLIVFWKRAVKTVTDEATGKDVEKPWAMLRFFTVFNADQADGLHDKWRAKPAGEHDPIEAAEALAAEYIGTLDSIAYGGDRAFYSPKRDHVQVPLLSSHNSPEEYYSTLFHELTHSTGHEARLNREGIVEGHRFGDELYSREELIAEMGAAMLCGVAGIEQVTLPNSAAYLAHWIGALKGDAKLLVSAAGAAQRASDLILGTSFEEDGEVAADKAA